jgi:hypothetical protein
MGVNLRTVRRAVLEPEVSCVQADYGPNAYFAFAPDIACPYVLNGTVAEVLTVLPRTHERVEQPRQDA